MCLSPRNASVQWQPGGLTIHAKKWFLGAGFLGAPPISLRGVPDGPIASRTLRGSAAQFLNNRDSRNIKTAKQATNTHIHHSTHIYTHMISLNKRFHRL